MDYLDYLFSTELPCLLCLAAWTLVLLFVFRPSLYWRAMLLVAELTTDFLLNMLELVSGMATVPLRLLYGPDFLEDN